MSFHFNAWTTCFIIADLLRVPGGMEICAGPDVEFLQDDWKIT